MKLLTFDLFGADMEGESRHAQLVMREMGIDYLEAVPQSIIDAWHFWGVSNLPDDLPEYMTISDKDPMKFIGYGLSQSRAEELSKH